MNIKSNDIITIIKDNIVLFEPFDRVYLFGSVLEHNKPPNDVDLLLIYAQNLGEVIEIIGEVSTALEKLIGMPVDLTVLSAEEENDTQFLKRIYSHSLKLK